MKKVRSSRKSLNTFLKWGRKRLNTRFDNRLESFVKGLLEVKGMEEILRDFGKGKVIFFQIRTIIQLTSLRHTLLDKNIPDAIKAVQLTKKQVSRSKYKEHLSGVYLDGPVDEVIRLGYVNLYHQLESYRNELLSLVNERGQELFGRPVDIAAYLMRVHKFRIDDLKNYPETIRRINWICNCVKHYGGYPRKKDPPLSCMGMDTTKKMVLSKEDLARDIDYTIQFTSRLFMCTMLAVGCIRIEDIFDRSEPDTKVQMGPSIALIASISVVYLNSLKEQDDQAFTSKWEAFTTWVVQQKGKAVS